MFKGNTKEEFNSSVSNQEIDDTIIGKSIKIEGDLVSNGNIIVEGEVVGSLKTERSLQVGDRARVVANVQAAEATVSGEIKGNVEVKGKLELTDSAKIFGDIKASILSIAAGAILNGNCSMGEKVNLKEVLKEGKVEKGKVEKKEDLQK